LDNYYFPIEIYPQGTNWQLIEFDEDIEYICDDEQEPCYNGDDENK